MFMNIFATVRFTTGSWEDQLERKLIINSQCSLAYICEVWKGLENLMHITWIEGRGNVNFFYLPVKKIGLIDVLFLFTSKKIGLIDVLNRHWDPIGCPVSFLSSYCSQLLFFFHWLVGVLIYKQWSVLKIPFMHHIIS